MNEERRERLADLVLASGLTVAVAESLSGGQLCAALAAAPGASDWFRGGIVAYASAVKHQVLGVPPGPVVSEPAAVEMARGVCRLLGADVSVAVTGVGGPARQDGREPGTVFVAVHGPDGTRAVELRLDGKPEEVVARTVDDAVERLLAHLTQWHSGQANP